MKSIVFILNLTLCALFCVQAYAQKIDFSDEFLQKMETVGIDFLTPLDTDYKDVFVIKNDCLSYDFAIRSRKEKLELRYILQPVDERNPFLSVPTVQFTRLLTHLATNDQEAVIAIHRLSNNDLEQFNADWGKIAFFQPKTGFADKPKCKLLSLYREGKGMAHVLFLYDKPSEAIDNRFYALRFQGDEDLK